jgi:ribonuclease P protein component
MLAAAHRLRRRQDFSLTVRRGRRAGANLLVVHLLTTDEAGPIRVGFVVPKSVGDAVRRKLVTRRLRHLVGDRLDRLPTGATMVVRALPGSAQADFATLGGALDSALARCLRPAR